MKHTAHRPLSILWRLCAAAVLVLGCLGAQAVTDSDGDDDMDDATGELAGELMFHADLLTTLDALCPARGGTARDWQAAVVTLPASTRDPELRELSRRLSFDAAQAMVRGSGGCSTGRFLRAYAATRDEYETLLEQWARSST